MKFTREEIAKALKLYVITDRSWLKEDETLLSVCEKVIQNGATFLQLREKELNAEETRKEAIELTVWRLQWKWMQTECMSDSLT